MNLNQAQQRIRWVTFATLIGLAILLTILDQTGNLDAALAFVRDPITVIMGWTAKQTDTAVDLLQGPRDLESARLQIDDLQTQLDEAKRQNEELLEVQGEYQRLLELFNRARQAPELRRLTATVVGHDSNLSSRSIIIDKGSLDGIRVGMPVESARGLVGQVFRTAGHSSQILLITDSSSAISSRLGNSRATGLLRGGGLGGLMSIEWIDLKFQIEIGEVVSTSGIGGKFPQDLVIGRIINVDRREAELFQRATVQPAVDFNALEVVFVIINFTPVDVDIFGTAAGS